MSRTSADAAGQGMTRREVVAAMAASAGAFVVPGPRAAIAAGRLIPRPASGAGGQAGAYVPKVYSTHEWATVQVLVDYVIPKDARSGSATDAAVPEFMDTMLDLEPGMRTANRGGLAWMDHQCHLRFGKDFIDCADPERRQLLDDIAYPRRTRPELMAGASWFSSFRDFTASGFFTSEMGVNDLGYQGNTAVPEWTGCPPESYARLGAVKP